MAWLKARGLINCKVCILFPGVQTTLSNFITPFMCFFICAHVELLVRHGTAFKKS